MAIGNQFLLSFVATTKMLKSLYIFSVLYKEITTHTPADSPS